MNSTRLTLVTFIGLTVVCLVVGTIGAFVLFGAVTKSNFRMQMANNEQYGIRFANAIQTYLSHGFTEEQLLPLLQESFESAPGERSRYLCVMTREGKLLCHPNSSIVGINANDMQMVNFKTRETVSYRDWVQRGDVEGIFLDDDGNPSELIRRVAIPTVPWDVLVHTRIDAILEESRAINRIILAVMIPMGIFFVLFGTVVARMLGRQYETAIEENNRHLEARVAERTCELEKTVRELSEARDALMLNEKLALLGQLVAGIAHEINNPLAAIRVTAEVMAEEAQDPLQKNAAEQISRGAQRCSLLVANLLSFARRDAPRITPTSLNDVVETSLSFCSAELRNGGVRLLRNLAPENPVLPLDRLQLEQAILNLVNNAFQAFDKEQPDRTIRVGTEVHGEKVRITVEDNGPGISHEMIAKLFEPFHTTKGSGTGLGLSLCKRFVESHGGTVRHERSDLGGAGFIIEIPVRSVTETTHDQEEEPAYVG